MLRRFSPGFSLVIGVLLIAIAFLSISFLSSQVESGLSRFFGTLGSIDSATANTYRRIYADRCLLQSAYFFLTGIVFLTVGLFKGANRGN